jgi:copper chaperone CopZ
MTTQIQISGMTCANCVRHVTEALAAIEGVADVHVDLSSGSASFSSADAVPRRVLESALDEAGYSLK